MPNVFYYQSFQYFNFLENNDKDDGYQNLVKHQNENISPTKQNDQQAGE